MQRGSSANLGTPRGQSPGCCQCCPSVKNLEAHLVLGSHTWVSILPAGRLKTQAELLSLTQVLNICTVGHYDARRNTYKLFFISDLALPVGCLYSA